MEGKAKVGRDDLTAFWQGLFPDRQRPPIKGSFQQRYVKRHAIYHNTDIHNEMRLFAAPKIRPTSGIQFLGLDSDRILEPSVGEIVIQKRANILPRHDRAVCK